MHILNHKTQQTHVAQPALGQTRHDDYYGKPVGLHKRYCTQEGEDQLTQLSDQQLKLLA